MAEKIRLAVCQLECHPAFYRDRLACLEEPFMSESYESSLSFLGTLSVPITEIQETFREQYIEWHTKRLQSLLTHPLLNEGIPSIIVFPEGSIPLNCLEVIYYFAKSANVNIVAGSHTILDNTEARAIYSKLGKEKGLVKRHTYTRDVTFVFTEFIAV